MAKQKVTVHLRGLAALKTKLSMKQTSGVRARIGKRKA